MDYGGRGRETERHRMKQAQALTQHPSIISKELGKMTGKALVTQELNGLN